MANIQERKSADGETSYRVRVRVKGAPIQSATFKRLTDAKRWAQQIEAAIHQGKHFPKSESRKRTLGNLIDRYLNEVLPQRPRSAPARHQQLLWWKDQLGFCVLADVTPALLSEKKELLKAGITQNKKPRTPATVNRYLAALSHALTYGVNEWEWIDSNPLKKVKKMHEPRGRHRFLSEAERNRLLEACKESKSAHLYTIVVLALSTGMRRGEILGLKWDDVDLHSGRITLSRTKNDDTRVVPVMGLAKKLLQQHAKVRRIDSQLVFPSSDPMIPVKITQSYLSAINKAKIPDFRFHDLRHSAASYLAMGGATLAEIAEVLGHKTLAMVKRYAHLSEAHTAGVVEKMNKRIFG